MWALWSVKHSIPTHVQKVIKTHKVNKTNDVSGNPNMDKSIDQDNSDWDVWTDETWR